MSKEVEFHSAQNKPNSSPERTWTTQLSECDCYKHQ